MARINASPAVLERVARELGDIAQDMGRESRSLRDAGNQAVAAWKSSYSPHYLGNVERVSGKITNTQHSIESIAAQLRNTAREIRRLEEDLAKKNSSGSGGGGGSTW